MKIILETCPIYVTGAPCLSFDVIPDDLGSDRENFPLTCYIVSGTQAAKGKPNYINIMKLDNITKTQRNLEQDDSDDDGDGGSAKVEMPSLQCVSINHSACVNRLRVGILFTLHCVIYVVTDTCFHI